MFFPGMFDSTTSNPSEGLLAAFSGNRSKAGIRITPKTAMAFSAVQTCVTLLAESVAQLPCELYRRTENGGRERATDHPLYDIIHNQPNGWQTSFEFYEQSQGALGLRGNDYSLIERNGRGHVDELIPISNDKIVPYKGEDGLPYYHLTDFNETVPHRFIHHVRAFSMDGYTGLSPIQTNPDAIGLALATEEHAASVFANGTTLSGVIERPLEAKEMLGQPALDKIKRTWHDAHAGLKNSFSVAILQEGMQYKQMAMSNEDAQLIESRQYGVNDVARLYKIPLHMVQHLEKATFSNIEHQGLQFVIYTLMAWLRRRETAMQRDLLLPKERKTLYIEFNVAGLLRGDQKTRYEAYALARQWGWLSVNDIRRLENLPPIKGGDTYLEPLNMTDAGNGELGAEAKKVQEFLS